MDTNLLPRKVTMLCALALFFLLTACSDNAPGPGSLGGQLLRIEDGTAYGPAVVALYELDELHVVARQETDPDGNFLFPGLDAGDYTPVVYDAERVLLHLELPSYRVHRGVHVQLELPMVPTRAYPNTGLYLEGSVLDSDDETPIPLALLEITAPSSSAALELFSEIDGRSGPLTQLSDEDGRFRLGPLPILVFPDGDRMVPHLRVSHPFYGDLARGPWLVPTLPTDLEIRMERGSDPGWIGGQILSYPDSTLLEGVPVSLEWQAVEDRFPKLLPPDLIAYSDAEGRFELQNIAAGRHLLRAGLLADDGWVGFPRTVTVAGSLLLDEPVLVSAAIPLLEPPNLAVLDSLSHLSWGEHTAAVAYEASLQRLTDGARWTPGLLPKTSWSPDAEAREFLAPGGRFLWSVIAFDKFGRDISLSERPSLFDLPLAESQP